MSMELIANAFRSKTPAPPRELLEKIRGAADRLRPHVRRTPILTSDLLNERAGRRIFCKAENLQITGSFKVRGALNKILQMTDKERSKGVAAFSAGNHAQALALAAQRAGTRATIFMPAEAPETKIRKTKARGAEVITYDRANDDRERLLAEFVATTGVSRVHPYDDDEVIAAGGSLCLEFLVQLKEEFSVVPDVLLVPCGGGGLVAGCATISSAFAPRLAVYAVEPAGFADTAVSISRGARTSDHMSGCTICDALVTPIPGHVTFPLNLHQLEGAVVVDDKAVRSAVRIAFGFLQTVVEPGGAIGLAAALETECWPANATIGLILSGGNVDERMFADILLSDGKETNGRH